MLILNPIKTCLKELIAIIKYYKIFKKYTVFTMVPSKDYIKCLNLINKFSKIDGSIIECGVWRGGMMGGIAELLGSEKQYYLFDSFEGLPEAKEIDGVTAKEWQQNKEGHNYHDNCKAEIEWAEAAMKKSKAKNVNFVKGWFEETVPTFSSPMPIAILRLDGDWYDSTMVCLEHLFPQVKKGGLIILDDYYAWDGCSKALHDYLSINKRAERIERVYSGGCFLVKLD